VDDFAEWLGYEKEMVRCSTWIVCTSQRLYERLRGTYPNSHIELIRNAYDDGMNLHLPEENTESLHESALSPEKKWVGYIGAWAPWVDELLVKKLSRLPEVEMVVVGPEYGKKYDSLNTSHNIHFLGLKPHHQLPSYIRRLSVCIIPFLLTPVTLATNPVKAYEYLAAGKSVVSTNMPECCLMSPHVDTVTNHEQFIETVSFRLNNPGDCSARTAFALEQTWGHRGEQIHKLISSGSSS
jgi:glycosyltransferase involved in cell wall biosynthesis